MEKKNNIGFRLYLITDRKLFPDTASMLKAVEEALKGGVRAVQLREKDLPVRELLEVAYRLRELTSRYNAGLFVNDRFDVALSAGADGVHLGQSGLPPDAVKRVVADRLLVGVSTHSLDEAMSAQQGGADFITFGPVYRTPSKLAYGEPVGPDALSTVTDRVSLPVFAIGGIGLERVREIIKLGAHGVALIRGILGAPDVRNTAELFVNGLDIEKQGE